MSGPSPAVFLSYASQDAGAAARIAGALRQAGIEVWFDQSELRGGDAWDRKIRREIRGCSLFIAVISAHTDARSEGYFRREWKLAVERTADLAEDVPFLVPVAIDDTTDAHARVPDSFHHVQWTRLPQGEVPPQFAQQVAELLKSAPAPAPALAPAPPPLLSDADAAAQAATGTPILDDAPAAPPTRRRGRRGPMLAAIAVALIGVAALVMVWRPWRAGPAPAAASVQDIALADKSVAVLPFEDLSEKHDQQYFADGLTEEIIDLLARMPGLRVPARTSSFYFRGKNTTISEIARQLNVATVLEGSVRKSGDRYRVTVQLVRGDTGAHLWSRTFEREAKDVFELQGEIAAAVASLIDPALSAVKGLAESRTSSPEAYQAYLEGRVHYHSQTLDEFRLAGNLFERAVGLDPHFAAAWARVGGSKLALYEMGAASRDVTCPAAKEATHRALRIDPDQIYARGELAWLFIQCDWDWTSAREQIVGMVRLAPHDPETLIAHAMYANAAGDLTAEERFWKESLAADPMDPKLYWNLAETQANLQHYADAEASLRRSHLLDPTESGYYAQLALLQAHQGGYAAARESLRQEPDASARRLTEAAVELLQGHRQAGGALTAALAHAAGGNREIQAVSIADLYALGGDANAAAKWLEEAYARREVGLIEVPHDPDFRAIRDDPRFKALVARLKLPESADLD